VDGVVATLSSNSVRVIATATTADEVSAAVTGAGYRCRLVGQGDVTLFGDALALRLGTDIRVGPGRYCLPRHRHAF